MANNVEKNRNNATEELTEQSTITTGKNQAGESSQKKYSPHTIKKERPGPSTSGYCKMSAPFGSGTFGGRITPIGYFEYLAGAKVKNLSFDFIIKMKELRHPSFDKFQLDVMAVFVPNSRVWDGADAFVAQKQSLAPVGDRPTTVPTVTLPFGQGAGSAPNSIRYYDSSGSVDVPYHFSSVFRESIEYAYYGPVTGTLGGTYSYLPHNILPVRGYNAMCNDLFLDRTTQAPFLEWKTNTVTSQEIAYFFTHGNTTSLPSITDFRQVNPASQLRRATTKSHYWNSFRSTVYKNNNPVDNTTLFTHNITQQMIDEFRLQSQNEDLTDQEIISQLRGTRVSNENVCQIIGRASVDIDISLQPQTSEGALSLGADGALSYTTAKLDLIPREWQSTRDGYIHYVYHIIASDDGMTAFSRNIEAHKTSWQDFYRPSLSTIRDRAFLTLEYSHAAENATDSVGFTDRFSEYFRHGKFVRGDFWNDPASLFAGDTRLDSAGFRTQGTLPTQVSWHGLRTDVARGSIAGMLPLKQNYSDFAIHRLLLNRGAVLPDGDSSINSMQKLLPFTFDLYGSITLSVDQPIDRKVKERFISFGEE